jgi:hypothetical protein
VLSATTAAFNQNYLAFLQAIASSMSVSVYAITVLSIAYGSVGATLQVTTTAEPNSPLAIQQQNGLQSVVRQSGSIAGMTVSSSTVTTNGGTNNDNNNGGGGGSESSGLSRTTIIILATVIPVGTLRKFAFI